MPKQINSAGVGQRLVQLFALKGRFQPVLDEVIVPVVSVDPEEVESYPASAFTNVVAGGAGTYAFFYLENPSDSDRIVTVERLLPVGAASMVFMLGYSLALLSGGSTATNREVWRDRRLPGTPTANLYKGDTTNDPSITGFQRIFTNGLNAYYDVHWVLGPGDVFTCATISANTAYDLSIQWSERFITTPGYR